MSSPLTLTPAQVRSVRILAQGLPPAAHAELVTTLAATGFVRTLGGSDVYVAARSRVPGTTRAQLDAAVAARELQVVPAVRGCIYLVPAANAPLCLRVAEHLSRDRDRRDADKAGIRPGELERLGDAVLAALTRTGPATTDVLRRALPEGSIRSLGDRGKKVGVSSPLPPTLRRLEFAGQIERTLPDGRLDTERYLWRVTARNPFTKARLPDDPIDLHARLLQRFAANAGVGTLRAFSAWAGIPLRDAKAAAAKVELVPVAIAGADEPAFATAGIEALLADAERADEAVALLPFEDNLPHLAGGPHSFVDEAFHGLSVPSWGNQRPQPLGTAAHLAFRSVLADGGVVGFWEYDPDARIVVTRCFQAPSRAAAKQLAKLADELGAFLRDELGHGHSFSLDDDDALRERLQMLAAISGGKPAAPAKPARARAKRRSG
ncbi:MAG: winged helix DNA-binding domain-containing protein [Planctomycetes bacterium]|nr:winged helix DNA-binding domain-containing protein [Planctomycetota bacterium]